MARRMAALEVGQKARAAWAAALVLMGACGGAPGEQSDAPAQPLDPPTEQFDALAPAVPFVDQDHPAGADASYDGSQNCGPALLAGIAKSRNDTFGRADAQLVELLATIAGTSPEDGTTGFGMIFVLRVLGMRTAATPGANMDFIHAELAAGHVVIACGDYYAVPSHAQEHPGGHSSHYIAVTGASGGWSRYRVTDPADAKDTSLTDAELETYIRSGPDGGGFTISAW